jgi:hypothetical protein
VPQYADEDQPYRDVGDYLAPERKLLVKQQTGGDNADNSRRPEGGRVQISSHVLIFWA